MDTAPQPTDDETAFAALMAQTHDFILGLIMFVDGVFQRLGSIPLSAKLARQLTRYTLIPAEAALRRAILIMAADLPLPVLRHKPRALPDTATPRAAAAPPPEDTKPRPPVFCMSEPQPRDPARDPARDTPRPETDDLPEDMLPRILALTDAVLYAPPAPLKTLPGPKDTAARFCRRLAALQAAFQDALGEAERWVRRRVRALARATTALKPALSSLTLPRLRKSLKQDERALLRQLTDMAKARFSLNTS